MKMRYPLVLLAVGVAALQPLPPPPKSTYNGTGPGLVFDSSFPKTIYVQSDLASHRDTGGLTLVPPSGQEFAETFRDDLTRLTRCDWSVKAVESFGQSDTGLFLDLINQEEEPTAGFQYASGQSTEEGYTLRIEANQARITGSGARGVWWGTRTLLQHLIISNWTSVPALEVQDAPAYATRGYMFDAGRKWYAPSFLKDLCTYASFFKMSEFHYHMSDNYPLNRGHNETWNQVYSQFSLRPESDAELSAGLVQRPNETLGRADFEDLQRHCASRGITVIPEIEAPGHCLSITKWKPELALEKKDLLNLTHPDSIPTVKKIWAEFLPWFQTKEVQVGADEYDSALADDYITFVNEMASFVNETSGKRTRIWGTEEPSENLTISKDVIIQHWQYGQSDPVQLQKAGYDLINSEDWWAYMSLKNDHMPILPAPYPQFFNETRAVSFAGQAGWQWQPALYNPVNTTEQLPDDAPGNKGAILAAWNDNGPDAATQLEAFYAMRRGIPLVAARAWSGARGPQLDVSTLEASVDLLSAQAPGQNLDRPSAFTSWTNTKDRQTSGSESLDDPSVVTALGHGSKGPNYTLTLSATGPFVLSSADVTLQLSDDDNSLTFIADGWTYPLRSVHEQDGFEPGHPGRIWANSTRSTHAPVTVSTPAEIGITGDLVGGSRVWVNGTFVGRFEVYVFGGKNTLFSWSQMAFVAPLETVSGGGLQSIQLEPTIKPPGGDNNGGTNTTTVPPAQSKGGRLRSRSQSGGQLLLLGFAGVVACLLLLH
ncbi:beta-N-acetylhexosaminidase- variant 1 [Apiospora saccharicola]|uniref:beta-N-acetylhexosaminidase n=1 Tax=Apiospora saccharicola TaxID=335842 RepID=A0ABR1WER7_9PEZI